MTGNKSDSERRQESPWRALEPIVKWLKNLEAVKKSEREAYCAALHDLSFFLAPYGFA
jgi:hypothetical protein